MNIRLLCRFLGVLSLLVGGFMLFSLPWAFPAIGRHTDGAAADEFEARGFWGLIQSTLVCAVVSGVLLFVGRRSKGRLYRKEAMAIVGLSWMLATLLGALPYLLSGTVKGTSVRLNDDPIMVRLDTGKLDTSYVEVPRYEVSLANFGVGFFRTWNSAEPITEQEHVVIRALLDRGPGVGLSTRELITATTNQVEDPIAVFKNLQQKPGWEGVLLGPGQGPRIVSADRAGNYRLRPVSMNLWDALFESQSGFSTTGATVITDLEDPYLVPHCILFWRSSTHFLGGLGIIVLFVVILGQGSAGKALMRAEMPGPTKEGAMARMQTSAWIFAAIYAILNAVLAIVLKLCGMTMFDAICHAFGTMATGGFSTYNASLGHFDSPLIEYIVTLFMVLAGTNFTLLFYFVMRKPLKMLADTEWRTYVGIIGVGTLLIIVFGMLNQDAGFNTVGSALRNGLFQVVSIITTTGFGTADFDAWNPFSRALILIMMFIGGCAGSTGGGMKVIRHLLFYKIIWLEVERSFRPRVVRVLRVGDKTVEEQGLRLTILVYVGLVLMLFMFSWLFVVACEPDQTWGAESHHRLIDSASAVAATLNNIGPGLGIVGATRNYAEFTGYTKLLFVWLMMLGRLEVFPVLVLFFPRFWQDQ